MKTGRTDWDKISGRGDSVGDDYAAQMECSDEVILNFARAGEIVTGPEGQLARLNADKTRLICNM